MKTKSLTQFTSFDRLAFAAKMGDALVYSCKQWVCPSSLKTAALKKNTHGRLGGLFPASAGLQATSSTVGETGEREGGERRNEGAGKGSEPEEHLNLEGRRRKRSQQSKPRANGERSR